jgi:hypothetical protein
MKVHIVNIGAFHTFSVMPGPVPGIHIFPASRQDVDGRNKSGHDEVERFA